MGLATIAAQVIFIGFILVFSGTLLIAYKDYFIRTDESFREHQELIKDRTNEKLTVQQASYDSVNNVTTIKINNSGTTKIELETLDIYVGQERIPRFNENRTLTLEYEIKNPGIFDPNELLSINVSKRLAPGEHSIEIFTENANSASGVVNV
ncbi:hypothetical protein GF327_03585 [Candidatus Woesearchaeota archaeon]|nr:hypothetical protein [Candidatus Woesearchaeota archaeon]